MDYALTVYPLSSGYQQRFESTIGTTPCYLSLGELRRLPFKTLLETLRKIDGRLLLPLEDINAKALLPVLQALAVTTRASSIEVLNPDFLTVRISRWRAALAIWPLAWATVAGRFALHRCGKELKELLRRPRVNAKPPSSGRVPYLKTNLWLGVKAGGSIGHIAGVVNGLVGRGWSIEFMSAESPVMLREEVSYQPIKALRAYGLPSEINLYRFHHSFLKQARSQINGQSASFIYQRMSIANFVGVQLSRENNLPLVIEYNGSEVWIARNWGTPLRYEIIAEQAEQACLRHAHLVVTISDALHNELVGRGVEPERIVVYPNGIDPGVFDPQRYTKEQSQKLRQRLNIAEDALLATFVGTFGQWHGAEVLAQAIHNLAVNDPEWLRSRRLHFMLVGDGLKMPEVKAILDNEHCKPFCTFAGLIPQAETPAYLAASDIYLSPHVPNQDGSRFFGSPTKLFEYMAMGGAIIASDLDQIGEVLSGSPHISHPDSLGEAPGSDQCAMLIQPGNVVEIEMALRYLVENSKWRDGLGNNARKLALEKYTWDSHVAAILEGLNRMTNADAT